MKILLDNVDVSSSSGPNSFGKRLIEDLSHKGHEIGTTVQEPDIQLSFIMAQNKKSKLALRLDGIYFNVRQDWGQLNAPIKNSFDAADLVIYQSNFNRELTEKFFGKKEKSVVINNGTCFETIEKIPIAASPIFDSFSEVWTCASSWRPHKRLNDNINYFLEKAPKDACMIIAGENPDYRVQHSRIFYAGKLSWENCISLYKRSKKFIHLAFLDHCPNVVVDARASGCEIVVASSGGTREVAGPSAEVIQDMEWDMSPLDLYSPPKLDYHKSLSNENFVSNIDIKDVGDRYINTLRSI